MRAIGIEINAGEIAADAGLMSLEQEMRAVVVRGIGAALMFENEIYVLVRFSLMEFRIAPKCRDHG